MAAARRRLLALSLGLGGAALLAGVVELAARGWEARAPDWTVAPAGPEDAVLLAPHPFLLWQQRPGSRQEHGVSVHINSLGLRGPEPTIPKPTGTRRILALGDSSVYGFGVELDDSFPRVAADRLGGQEARIEAIPAALPGYSTLQLLNLLELRAMGLEPDLIVVAALWSDHATAAVEDERLLDRYQRFEAGPWGALDRSLRRSALYRVLSWELGVRRGAQAEARAHYAMGEPHPDGGTHRVPPAAYQANLEALAAQAARHDAGLAFLILPHPEDITGRAQGESSFQDYRRAMRAVARAQRAPLVDGAQLFRQAGVTDPDALFWDNIHPNREGHRLLGEGLAEALAAWELQTR
jgi:lysophospholipase L1-like esterase